MSSLSFATPASTDVPRELSRGVEYMTLRLAQVHARTGVKRAKAARAGFSWGDIEPEPHQEANTGIAVADEYAHLMAEKKEPPSQAVCGLH